jgi:hypothetical protein
MNQNLKRYQQLQMEHKTKGRDSSFFIYKEYIKKV